MTRFARVIDMERCMGCRACIAACHTENHLTPGSPWITAIEYERGRYPNARTVFATVGCMHCEDPPCQVACDGVGAHAISRNDYGVVIIDYDRCIGCRYCAAACPYGAPQYNHEVASLFPEGGADTPHTLQERHPTHRKRAGVVEKCTQCWHKLEPAIEAGRADLIGKEPRYTPSCDAVCPVGARIFGDLDDPESAVSRHVARKNATQIKKAYGTRPLVHYVLEGGDF
ncbi:MAG: 4Fe-4S dicluster domain-containing protein [Gammaproteobacteria bacterium]|nr:4Fe-4S dicluster domain-containing protein [Gammaproteobacteria bacterium]NIT15303.1 4Fe-4S dicluster domain-containing protein [Gammaproteobacteria bacterium]